MKKTILKVLAGIVVFLVAVFVVATLAAGSIIKGYINDNGPALIARQMHVEDASLNLFTGYLSLDSLMIAEADGQTRFLSVHRFEAKLSVPQILLGVYELNDIDVDRLCVDIEQQDTVFNFSDILAFLNESDDDEPLPLVLHNINLHNSSISYRDLLVKSDFSIRDFSLFIPGVDLREVNTSVGMELSLDQGGSLATRMEYDERKQTYGIHLQLTDFNLQSLLPYLRQQMAVDKLEGRVNLALDVNGSLQHMLEFTLTGNAGVRGFNLVDPDGKPMVQCDSVAIGVRDLDLAHNRIELSRIVFDKPYIRIAYGKDSLDNFSRLMAQTSAPTADDNVPQPESGETTVSFNGHQESLRLVVDRLSIQDASLSYLDESLVAEPFEYELTNVTFHAPGFSLDGQNHITGSARLGNRGSLKFCYDGPISDQRNMKMTLQADGIDFADFSPYTVQMFGNEITGGTMSLNMLAQTTEGMLIAENRFVLNNPKVEKKRRDIAPEMNIPFRTGMYLLTDRNNVCDIDLPVKGNIDEPKFSYKRLVFRTLGKLIVKVATSPFRRQKSSTGVALSAEEVLELDDRSLDDISLDSISTDLMTDE